jgi:hypothetical protein
MLLLRSSPAAGKGHEGENQSCEAKEQDGDPQDVERFTQGELAVDDDLLCRNSGVHDDNPEDGQELQDQDIDPTANAAPGRNHPGRKDEIGEEEVHMARCIYQSAMPAPRTAMTSTMVANSTAARVEKIMTN